jgi:hypothetical protein
MTRQQWCEDERLASTEPVVSLLRAAAAPTEPGPQPGEQAALAAFRATASPRRFSMHSLVPVKAALAAAVTGGVLLTGGVAAAATGTLPGAAQDTARTILSHVGVSVPGADGSSAGHADQRGTSGSTEGTTQGTGDEQAATDQQGTDEQAQGDGSQGKGAVISQLAKGQYATGHDRGAAVSEAASGGKSQAGDAHGKAGQDHGTTGEQSDHAASGQAHRPATPGDQAKAAAQDNQPTTGRDANPGQDASTSATAGQHQR